MKKVLFVLTNHDSLGDTGRKTGFFLSEAAHPYKKFTDAGVEVDFVSPLGGKVPIDGKDTDDEISIDFLKDKEVMHKLENTKKPKDIDPHEYDVIFYVGGHGTMWDFPDDISLATIGAAIYNNGGVVSAVCHGPAGLLNIALPSGQYLITNKKLTSFTNEEELAVGLEKVVPFLLENMLKNRGVLYTAAPKFTENVVVDGRLITGQNPQSASKVAEEVLKIFIKDSPETNQES
jgi:putative intracellular protease/amidase